MIMNEEQKEEFFEMVEEMVAISKELNQVVENGRLGCNLP